jgi:glucose-6-phosphate isomerase
MRLTLHSEPPGSQSAYRRFERENVLPRLRRLVDAARRDLSALNAADDPLIAIGMETASDGQVMRNGYGMFEMAWRREAHARWARQVNEELGSIARDIKAAHGTPIRFLVWAGMGGSVEDKSAYAACGLLGNGIRFYALDSTDPAKLRGILDDLTRRSGGSRAAALRSTLVVGMALGMTSYEPVVNIQALARLYERERVDSRANILYITLPGSVLDRFAGPRGFRRVPQQLDGRYTTSGRHSSPLGRGSLYPLGLAKANLGAWMRATDLRDAEIDAAHRLAAFVHANGTAGRDKVTLRLPARWAGAALWIKQAVEESLGKSEALGVKIVIDEPLRGTRYRPADDRLQDRVFLEVDTSAGEKRVQALVRAGYPVARLRFGARTPLSALMQFMHHMVFGLAYLREMNFVTQPSVELYKAIAARIHRESQRVGGPERTRAWQRLMRPPRQSRWGRHVSVHFDDLPGRAVRGDAADQIAMRLAPLAGARAVEYGEMTYFGDLRITAAGRRMARVLDDAATALFRRALAMPVDVYEGPAMNHSYHEMIIGHGRCFSIVLLSRSQAPLKAIGYTADYHVAQFLATKAALAQRRRPVLAIVLSDLSPAALAATKDLFDTVAARLGALAGPLHGTRPTHVGRVPRSGPGSSGGDR